MKIINKTSLLLLISIAAFTGSCTKDSVEGFESEPTKAKITIMNYAPSPVVSPAKNYGYIIRINEQQLYTATLNNGAATGYFVTNPGSVKISLDTSLINIAGPSAVGNVASITQNFEANKYYSVFTSGLIASPTFTVTEDDISRPAAGKAKVRLVNVSPDATALNIFYRLATEPASAAKPLYTAAIEYRKNGVWLELPVNAYILEIRNNLGVTLLNGAGPGTIDPIVDPTTNEGGVASATYQINFKEYKVYTLVLRGYVTPTPATGNSRLVMNALINRYW